MSSADSDSMFRVHSPAEVLSFWFSDSSLNSTNDAPEFSTLSDDAYLSRMVASVWPGLGFKYELKHVPGGAAAAVETSESETSYFVTEDDDELDTSGLYIYDECEQFLPAMQAAARMKLGWTEENDHAILARIILLDQMFSLLHRGRGEEYPFLTEKLVEQCGDMARCEARRFIDDAETNDTLPLAHLMFLVSPMMRSEDITDHNVACEFVKRHSKIYEGKENFKQLVASMEEHRNVLKRFRRFPHRNAKCARKSTPEEREWLNNKQLKPSWAEEYRNYKLPMQRTTSGSTLLNDTVVTAAKRVSKQDAEPPASPKTPKTPKTKSKVTKPTAKKTATTVAAAKTPTTSKTVAKKRAVAK